MSQQGKLFKQRYYQDINTLSLCRPVLLFGNCKSENVEAVESVQPKILLEHYAFKSLYVIVTFS